MAISPFRVGRTRKERLLRKLAMTDSCVVILSSRGTKHSYLSGSDNQKREIALQARNDRLPSCGRIDRLLRRLATPIGCFDRLFGSQHLKSSLAGLIKPVCKARKYFAGSTAQIDSSERCRKIQLFNFNKMAHWHYSTLKTLVPRLFTLPKCA